MTLRILKQRLGYAIYELFVFFRLLIGPVLTINRCDVHGDESIFAVFLPMGRFFL